VSYRPTVSLGGYRPSYGLGGFRGGRRYYAVGDSVQQYSATQPVSNSNSALIIGLSVGGALLVVLVVVVVVLVTRRPHTAVQSQERV